MTESPYIVELQRDTLTVRMSGLCEEWEQWFLLTGCVHWDSPHCDRATLKRHLDKAAERKAGIFTIGDWFDAMGGKYDPRSSKQGLRPEFQVDNYLDTLVNLSASYIEPYSPWWISVSQGNHESNIERRHETNITQRLVDRVNGLSNNEKSHKVYALGYAGHIRFMFSRDGKGTRSSKLMFFTHGDGGNSPVTRGAIDTNRKAVWNPNADIVLRAHNHQSWIIPVPRLRVTDGGREYVDEQLHIDVGTYKKSFDLKKGWEIEKGFGPSSIGGVWIRFFNDCSKLGCVGMEAILAR